MVRALTALAATTCLLWPGLAEQPKPSIGIFMDFEVPPASLALEAMKNEVAAIMKTTGLTLGWRSLKANRGREAFSGLVVLRFKGKCQVQPWTEPAPAAGTAMTLGQTLVSEGGVLPFSEVECEQVRKSVPYGDPSAGEQERQSALGRAMGRVVAHELYHVLAKSTEHAAAGVAKATQSLRDLVGNGLRFQLGDTSLMRKGMVGGPAAAALPDLPQ